MAVLPFRAHLPLARPLWMSLFLASAMLWVALPAPASAQLYKWVDGDGKVHYTDTPPPPGARTVEARSRAAGQAAQATAPLPYALQQATSQHPVTLYTTSNCAPCEQARRYLATRGVPVTEKTVTSNEDIAALQASTGSTQLPVLAVGRQLQQGFQPQAWQQALDAAGYPAQSRLPAAWKNPAPSPLVAVPQATAQAGGPGTPGDAGSSSARAAPAAPALPVAREATPTGNTIPGFRF